MAGWDLVPGQIKSDTVDGSISLSAISRSLTIWTGSINYTEQKLVLGKLPISGTPYGFAVFSGSGDITNADSASVLITKDQARLGGWDLSPGKIYTDYLSGSVSLDALSQSLLIYTGSINPSQPKIALGKLPISDSPYGFAVFSGSGDITNADSASILITKDQARLAGWELSPGKLSSDSSDGSVRLDASEVVFAVHTGSLTTTDPKILLGRVSSSIKGYRYGLAVFSGSGVDIETDAVVLATKDVARIGGWDLQPGKIYTDYSGGSVSLDATQQYFAIYTGSIDTDRPKIVLGKLPFSGTPYGFAVLSGSTSETWDNADSASILITKSQARLGGWELSPGKLYSDSANGSVAIDGTNKSISIYEGALTSAKKVGIGLISGSTTYGFGIFDGTSTYDVDHSMVWITSTEAKLAGWDLVPGQIKSDTAGGSVSLSAVSRSLSIWTGSINYTEPKLVLGKLPISGTPYGFAVFSGSGDVTNADSASVLITKDQAKLGGWELQPGKLISGDNALIDGNNAVLALGTNAVSSPSVGAENLVYMSSSGDFSVGSSFNYTGVTNTLVAAGWKLSPDALVYPHSGTPTFFISGSASGTYGTTANMVMSASNFILTSEGDITGSQVLFTGGTIAGWDIDGTSLKKGTDIILDASGKKLSINNGAMGIGYDVGGGGNHGVHVDSDNYWYSDSRFNLGGSGGIDYDGSTLTIGSSTTIQGLITAETGSIGGWLIADGYLSSSLGGMLLSGSGVISASGFYVSETGAMTASAGEIAGWEVATGSLSKGSLELNSDLPGLRIKNVYDRDSILIASRSMGAIGVSQDMVQNDGFESGSWSAGQNIGTEGTPLSITSWSFETTGPVSHSITDRSAYPDDDKALSGNNTFDFFVNSSTYTALGTGSNYFYEMSQSVAGPDGGIWTAGYTLFTSVATKVSHSLQGAGAPRSMDSQYLSLWYYSASSAADWHKFYPDTGSSPGRSYNVGSQFQSVSATTEIPKTTTDILVTVSGSLGADVELNTGSPYTEIQFDNFTMKQDEARIELVPDGILIYASPSSYIKLTRSGLEIQGGQSLSVQSLDVGDMTTYGSMTSAGNFAGATMAPYDNEPEDIAASTGQGGLGNFRGNTGEFSRGNHRHEITFDIIDKAVGSNIFSNMSATDTNWGVDQSSTHLFTGSLYITGSVNITEGLTVGGNSIATVNPDGDLRVSGDIVAENYIVSSSVTHMTTSFSSGSTIFGDTSDDTHQFTGSILTTEDVTVGGSLHELSALKYKTNVKPLNNQLDKILGLQGVEFDYKKDGEHSIGLIAENVEDIYPELVGYNKQKTPESVIYSRIVSVLVESVKELNEKMIVQEERIKELENK